MHGEGLHVYGKTVRLFQNTSTYFAIFFTVTSCPCEEKSEMKPPYKLNKQLELEKFVDKEVAYE